MLGLCADGKAVKHSSDAVASVLAVALAHKLASEAASDGHGGHGARGPDNHRESRRRS